MEQLNGAVFYDAVKWKVELSRKPISQMELFSEVV